MLNLKNEAFEIVTFRTCVEIYVDYQGEIVALKLASQILEATDDETDDEKEGPPAKKPRESVPEPLSQEAFRSRAVSQKTLETQDS